MVDPISGGASAHALQAARGRPRSDVEPVGRGQLQPMVSLAAVTARSKTETGGTAGVIARSTLAGVGDGSAPFGYYAAGRGDGVGGPEGLVQQIRAEVRARAAYGPTGARAASVPSGVLVDVVA